MGFPDIISNGHVALVTGAGSGIGRAAARRFAGHGMAVAMVDLAGEALDRACAEVAAVAPAGSGSVIPLAADLAQPDDVASMCDRVLERFGKVNLLMNNAASRTGRGFDAPMAEWRQVMEVNYWAIVETIRLLLPHMEAAQEPAMIVNVGSKQGITNPPGHPIYNIAKSALKTYCEQLAHHCLTAHDRPRNAPISAHLLIPGWTTTGKAAHKPGAWLPDQVIDRLIAGLGAGDFYILCPDDEVTTEMDHRRIVWAAEDITLNRPPLSRWHPDHREEAARRCS